MITTQTAPGTVSTWTLDPAHTQVEFEVKHMMFAKVRGRFTDVEGTIVIGSQDEDSTTTVTIRPASIDTGQPQRDEHLRSADFFDVEQFPRLTFEGPTLRRDGGRLVLEGDLSIRDVVRPLELDVEETVRIRTPGLRSWASISS